MSGQNESDSEELRRLKAELASRDDEVEQLRVAAASAEREISDLRHLAREESEQIDQLQEDAAASQRIERAQRALIAELRAEVGEEERAELELRARLRAAELELVNLRAIRDALLPPTLVQREGMAIAAEVIPAESDVGGDFFFVGDGPRGTVVAAVGDVVGKGLQAARLGISVLAVTPLCRERVGPRERRRSPARRVDARKVSAPRACAQHSTMRVRGERELDPLSQVLQRLIEVSMCASSCATITPRRGAQSENGWQVLRSAVGSSRAFWTSTAQRAARDR